MARSVSIWVVTRDFDVVAAFTVKHELVTWLGKQNDYMLECICLTKCKDNPTLIPGHPEWDSPDPEEIDIWDLLGHGKT